MDKYVAHFPRPLGIYITVCSSSRAGEVRTLMTCPGLGFFLGITSITPVLNDCSPRLNSVFSASLYLSYSDLAPIKLKNRWLVLSTASFDKKKCFLPASSVQKNWTWGCTQRINYTESFCHCRILLGVLLETGVTLEFDKFFVLPWSVSAFKLLTKK